jgi:hypothetical protein
VRAALLVRASVLTRAEGDISMHTMKRRVRCALAGVGFCAALSSAPGTAQAYDWKQMPASACTPEAPSAWWNYGVHAWTFTVTGGLHVSGYGNAQYPLRVGCPVVRDVAQNTNGLAELVVYVFDTQTNAEISCTATSSSNWGSVLQQVGPVSSGVAWSGGYKQLTFNVSQSGNWGRYHVMCSITPGWGMTLEGIGWAEHGGDGW